MRRTVLLNVPFVRLNVALQEVEREAFGDGNRPPTLPRVLDYLERVQRDHSFFQPGDLVSHPGDVPQKILLEGVAFNARVLQDPQDRLPTPLCDFEEILMAQRPCGVPASWVNDDAPFGVESQIAETGRVL